MKNIGWFFLLPFAAIAEPITITWDHPLQYEDGTVLSPSEITKTEVICSNYYEGWPNSFPVSKPCPFGTIDVPGEFNEVTIDVAVPKEGAKFFFRARTWVGDSFSEYSNEASKEFNKSNPKPPVISITVQP